MQNANGFRAATRLLLSAPSWVGCACAIRTYICMYMRSWTTVPIAVASNNVQRCSFLPKIIQKGALSNSNNKQNSALHKKCEQTNERRLHLRRYLVRSHVHMCLWVCRILSRCLRMLCVCCKQWTPNMLHTKAHVEVILFMMLPHTTPYLYVCKFVHT